MQIFSLTQQVGFAFCGWSPRCAFFMTFIPQYFSKANAGVGLQSWVHETFYFHVVINFVLFFIQTVSLFLTTRVYSFIQSLKGFCLLLAFFFLFTFSHSDSWEIHTFVATWDSLNRCFSTYGPCLGCHLRMFLFLKQVSVLNEVPGVTGASTLTPTLQLETQERGAERATRPSIPSPRFLALPIYSEPRPLVHKDEV